MAVDPRLRTFKIKTGVVKRLTKEKTVYEREVEQQRIRIEKLKRDARDDYEIRKQVEVLNESIMMIPDCQRRLLVAFDELKSILDSEKDLRGTETYTDARRVLEDAKPHLPKPSEVHMLSRNMNFLKYQNLSLRSLNIEVPIITDPRINVFETLYSQSNDELWVDSWLQQNCIYRPIPKVKISKGNNISINEAQKSLKECLVLLDKLTRTQQNLQDNVASLSTTEWKQKTIEIGTIKDQFTRLMARFENGESIFTLKRAVDKRKKKRLREKKKKEFWKDKLSEKYENRKKLHKSIDEWLRSMKEEAEKAKMEENMKKDADCVLAEVTKKKSDARKQLSLVTSLTKLRSVRDQIAAQRGERVSLEDRQAFNITTEKLLRMWESCMKTYSTEEQGLRLMIEKTASEDSRTARITKERQLLENWYTIFFGPRQVIPQDNQSYWALTAAERDMETFIAIRKSWDTFLVSPSNEMGSKIPVGWVLPDTTASENWSKYLATN